MSSPAPLGDLIIKNSRIPYRDPRVKSGDDIVGNSKIPNLKFPEFRIPNLKFPKLEFLKLEFLVKNTPITPKN